MPKCMSDLRSQQRFRRFLEQYRDAFGGPGSWQDAAAEKLGVTQGMISKYVNGAKDAGIAPIEEAIRGFGIDPEFFFGERDVDGDFRDFPRRTQNESRVEPLEAAYPALDEFLATPYGSSLSGACVAFLRGVRFSHGAPSARTYRALAGDWEDRQSELPKLAPAPVVAPSPPREGRVRLKK